MSGGRSSTGHSPGGLFLASAAPRPAVPSSRDSWPRRGGCAVRRGRRPGRQRRRPSRPAASYEEPDDVVLIAAFQDGGRPLPPYDNCGMRGLRRCPGLACGVSGGSVAPGGVFHFQGCGRFNSVKVCPVHVPELPGTHVDRRTLSGLARRRGYGAVREGWKASLDGRSGSSEVGRGRHAGPSLQVMPVADIDAAELAQAACRRLYSSPKSRAGVGPGVG